MRPPPITFGGGGVSSLKIVVRQNQATVSAGITGVKVDYWSHFKTTSDSRPDCQSSVNYSRPDSEADRISISPADNNLWVCFKAQVGSQAQTAGYQIDYNPPEIRVAQSGQVIQASSLATDLDDPAVWNYVFAANADCRPADFQDSDSIQSGSAVNSADLAPGQWVCFRLLDRAFNPAYSSYRPGQISRVGPVASTGQVSGSRTKSVVSTQGVITATVNIDYRQPYKASYRLSGGSYDAYSRSSKSALVSTNCNASTVFDENYSYAGIRYLSRSDSGKYVCFYIKAYYSHTCPLNPQATCTTDETIYAKSSAKIAPPAVITVAQISRQLRARVVGNYSVAWRWVRLAHNSDSCNSSTNFSAIPNGSTAVASLSSSDDQKYYCFRAIDTYNNKGYKKVFVNFKINAVKNINFKEFHWSGGVRGEPTPGFRPGDKAGYSVSLSGQRMAVGAPYYDASDHKADTGAVYVYKKVGPDWVLEQKIFKQVSSILKAADWFGQSVSLDGDRLAVGAHLDDAPGGCSNCGAVYIFKRTGAVWTLEEVIADGENIGGTIFDDLASHDYFGRSVSLSGDRLAVGAYSDDVTGCGDCGAVYIFKRTGTVWTLEEVIADGENIGGTVFNHLSQSDGFSSSVSLTSDRLAVGAFGDDVTGCASCGAVYIFKRTGTVWTLEEVIADGENIGGTVFNNLQNYDKFGRSVSLTSDRLAVGAYGDYVTGCATGCGAVYIFKRTGTVWALEEVIADGENIGGTVFDDLKRNDYFGYSVSLTSDRLAVGAYGDDATGCTDCGAVYIFKRTGTSWSKETAIYDGAGSFSDLENNDWFGYSVSLDGDRLIAGAHQDDVNNGSNKPNSGASYLFERNSNDNWSLQQSFYWIPYYHFSDGGRIPVDYINLPDRLVTYGFTANYQIGSSNTSCFIQDSSYQGGFYGTYQFVNRKIDYRLDDANYPSFWGKYSAPCVKAGSGLSNYAETHRLTLPVLTADSIKQVGQSVYASPDIKQLVYHDSLWYLPVETGSEIETGWERFSYKVAKINASQDCNRRAIFGSQNQAFDYEPGSLLPIAADAVEGDQYCFAIINATQIPHNSTITYYRALTITLKPVIEISQNGLSLQASSANTNLPASPVWQYSGPHSQEQDCASSSLTYSNGKTVSQATAGRYYCFKVTDKSSQVGYSQKFVVTPPAISPQFDQYNNQITASGSGLTDFHYFTSTTDPTNCNSSQTTWTAGATATSLTGGHWVCFRAQKDDFYGYGKIRVNPLFLTQNNLTVSATTSGFSNHQAFVGSNSSEPVCDSTATGWVSGNSIAVTSVGYWVCFRAQKSGSWHYAKIKTGAGSRIGYGHNSPLVQNGYSLSLSKTGWTDFTHSDAHIPNYVNGYRGCSAYPANKNTMPLDVSQLMKSNYPSYGAICIKGKNERGISRQGVVFIDQPYLYITAGQVEDNLLVYFSTRMGGGRPSDDQHPKMLSYSGPHSASTCDSSLTFVDFKPNSDQRFLVKLSKVTANRYYCLKAVSSYGFTTYTSFYTFDFTEGSNNSITASATGATDFAYYRSDLRVSCKDSYVRLTGWSAGKKVTDAKEGEYICFKAKKDNQWIYGLARANLNPPPIVVSQNNTSLTASADSKLLPISPSWFKSGPSSTKSCNKNNTFTAGNQVTGAQNGKYYCFKVTGKNGKIGYQSYLVNLTAPTITVSQATSGSTTTVTASSTASLKPNTWKYEKGLTSSACSSSTTIDDGSSNTATVTYAADNNKYVCFSAQNSLGVPGYGSYKVEYWI